MQRHSSYLLGLLLVFITATASFQQAKGQCFPTGQIVANHIFCDSVDFVWQPVPMSNAYEYFVTQSASPPGTPFGTGIYTPVPAGSMNMLTASTTYYIHVRSSCPPLISAFATQSFTTIACGCTAPSGIVTTPSSNGAAYNWTAVTGAIGYEHAVTTSSTPPTSGTYTTTASGSTGSLTASTTYFLHVRTRCNISTYSGWTTVTFSTTGSSSCATPTGLSATPSGNSVSFNWNTVSGAIAYEYIVNTSSATPTGAGNPTSSASGSTGGLTAATTYYIHVRAQCGTAIFSSWASPVSFTTTGSGSCAAPTGINATPSSNSVSMSWGAVSGATEYEYLVDQSSSAPAGAGTTTTATSATQGGLSPMISYFVHVRTKCGSTYSAWAPAVSFTTTTMGCMAPQNLTEGHTLNTVYLSWQPVTSSVGFEYIVDQSPNTPAGFGTYTTLNSAVVDKLQPSTKYYVHMRTKCGGNVYSNWSNNMSFTTWALGVSSAPTQDDVLLSAYPNPAGNTVTVAVKYRITAASVISITGVDGKKVKETKATGEQTNVDVSELRPGIYFIRYADEQNNATILFRKL